MIIDKPTKRILIAVAVLVFILIAFIIAKDSIDNGPEANGVTTQSNG